MRKKTFFQRRHEKRVDLKTFEKSTVSTLLIPKHLVEKLDLVLPVETRWLSLSKPPCAFESLRHLLLHSTTQDPD